MPVRRPSATEPPEHIVERVRRRLRRLRVAVTTRTHLLITTAYLTATSVIGVEIVAGLLGMSALMPIAIPLLLTSVTLIALARAGLRRFRARRSRTIEDPVSVVPAEPEEP